MKSGISSFLCYDISQVADEMTKGAGALIVTQESILGDAEGRLRKALTSQPAWSDIPLLVLTPQGKDAENNLLRLESVGPMILIKRPVFINSFISTVRSALRDRSRQYELRAYIVERERQAEALQQAVEKADSANKAKTEFLANVSHEIRTPLSVVIGLSEILERSSPLSAQQVEYVRMLKQSANSLLNLINDLLNITRIESRKVDVEKIPFTFEPLIRETLAMMTLQADEKRLDLRAEYDSVEGRMFAGDPHRIKQILTNLCSNAVKFTEKGIILLKIWIEEGDSGTAGKIVNVHINVTDTGPGIPEEKLDNIFDKFTQADSSISRRYGGTGLGLAITRSLAELMGGTISAQSSVNSGSSFTVVLPLLALESKKFKTKNKKLIKGQVTGSKGHVLLVDDHEPNLLVASTLLRQFGFSCDTAESGLTAIDRIKNADYAAVLMDVQMPGMDGLEATRAIREIETGSNKPPVPIIGMTAYAMEGDREKCLAAGMDDYLSKPFKPVDLEIKLLNFIE